MRVPEPQLDAWRALLGAHAALVRRVDAALSAVGLPPLAWYDVLWAVRRAPERSLRMGALSEEVTALSRTGLTRLVDRIEAAGLLERRRRDEDRRGTWVVLTAAGEDTLRRMWPVYARELQRAVVASLDDREAELLTAALRRIQAAASAPSR